MRIVFLGPASSQHIHNWCKWFSKRGHEVHVISFDNYLIENVRVHSLGLPKMKNEVGKLAYITKVLAIKKIIKDIEPDIVSVHYASSYGTVAALAGIKRWVLSVWGSDIYEFPRKGIIHRIMLKYSLASAGLILATSNALKKETEKYTKNNVVTTYWGIDTDLFSPLKRIRSYEKDGKLIIGTVKGLSAVYGIEYILRATKLFIENNPSVNVELRIAGNGPLEDELKRLGDELGLTVIWLGHISSERASYEWANMDIAIIPSIRESFGVAALEAQACGVPVIASNIEGLNEAVFEKYNYLVPVGDIERISKCIEQIMNSRDRSELRRRQIINNYNIEKCFEKIERIFGEIQSDD